MNSTISEDSETSQSIPCHIFLNFGDRLGTDALNMLRLLARYLNGLLKNNKAFRLSLEHDLI